MNTTALAIAAGLGVGVAIGSLFGFVAIGAGVGIAIGTLAAGVIDTLADQNAELRRLASLRTVNAILVACPSPAFALSSSRKILAFNPSFQQLVRRQLPAGQGEEARSDLRLALDLNVADIFSRLEANGDLPVVTGFVLGAGDRRYRAQLNVVRAPVSEPELLLAFVFGG